MLRIAIVEDDAQYALTIGQYLQRYKEEENVAFETTFFSDGDGILQKYNSQFDVILMDIEMPLVDGLSAAREIREKDDKVIIIFITNMANLAVKGYEVDAFHYIVKPVEYFQFEQVLKSALSRVNRDASKYLIVKGKGETYRIAADDILYAESQRHTLYLHTIQDVVEIRDTMDNLEQELEGCHFSRGNKGYLINLRFVKSVKNEIAVVGEEEVQLSRRRKDAFMQELMAYWGDM